MATFHSGKTLGKLMSLSTHCCCTVLFCQGWRPNMSGSCFRVWKGVSILLTTILLMYIYTACWLNNHVVQLCPFWCNGYSVRLSRPLTPRSVRSRLRKHCKAWAADLVMKFAGTFGHSSHSHRTTFTVHLLTPSLEDVPHLHQTQ